MTSSQFSRAGSAQARIHMRIQEWNGSNRESTASTPGENETPAEKTEKTGAWGLMPDWISNYI